jgi:hypothetical protein
VILLSYREVGWPIAAHHGGALRFVSRCPENGTVLGRLWYGSDREGAQRGAVHNGQSWITLSWQWNDRDNVTERIATEWLCRLSGGSFVPLGTHARSSLRAVSAPFRVSWS